MDRLAEVRQRFLALEPVLDEKSRRLLARLSHLEGIFDYFHAGTIVKVNACNRAMSKTVAVKTYPL